MSAADPAGALARNPAFGLLEVAVPMWIIDVASWTEDRRLAAARECGQIIASQGDTLMFGGGRKFGNGAREIARHQDGNPGTCTKEHCSCKGSGCGDVKCWCHVRGEPSYSAGEVFNALARGLACAAYQPGGITFAGMHFEAPGVAETPPEPRHQPRQVTDVHLPEGGEVP